MDSLRARTARSATTRALAGGSSTTTGHMKSGTGLPLDSAIMVTSPSHLFGGAATVYTSNEHCPKCAAALLTVWPHRVCYLVGAADGVADRVGCTVVAGDTGARQSTF